MLLPRSDSNRHRRIRNLVRTRCFAFKLRGFRLLRHEKLRFFVCFVMLYDCGLYLTVVVNLQSVVARVATPCRLSPLRSRRTCHASACSGILSLGLCSSPTSGCVPSAPVVLRFARQEGLSQPICLPCSVRGSWWTEQDSNLQPPALVSRPLSN